MNEEKKTIESFKRYIIFQESTLDDYYKMDEEYYKDKIEQLELSIKLLKTVLNLLEKKDKIIDEMATYIATLDIEEDICVKVGKENGCDQMAYGECEECIKKYFERKAKNE